MLLTIAFRSIVISATAILLNLLSVGAAYGLLVLVFQQASRLGCSASSTSTASRSGCRCSCSRSYSGSRWITRCSCSSRIKERHDDGADTTDSIIFGVATTARIITGAAFIIVAAFAGFATGDLVMFQQMGFGVGVALLIDATVIRSVVLPSAMALLDRWNWYLPHWLAWLPRLDLEAPSAPTRVSR